MPFPLEVLHTIQTDDMELTEAWLHTHFESKRTSGEWFQLSEEDVHWLMSITKWESD